MQIYIQSDKLKNILFKLSNLLILTAAVVQEESTECAESHKEENVDGQDNTDKFKGETKAVAEESSEIFKKEVN